MINASMSPKIVFCLIAILQPPQHLQLNPPPLCVDGTFQRALAITPVTRGQLKFNIRSHFTTAALTNTAVSHRCAELFNYSVIMPPSSGRVAAGPGGRRSSIRQFPFQHLCLVHVTRVRREASAQHGHSAPWMLALHASKVSKNRWRGKALRLWSTQI